MRLRGTRTRRSWVNFADQAVFGVKDAGNGAGAVAFQFLKVGDGVEPGGEEAGTDSQQDSEKDGEYSKGSTSGVSRPYLRAAIQAGFFIGYLLSSLAQLGMESRPVRTCILTQLARNAIF